MQSYACPEHGKIRVVGAYRKPNNCPICGKRVSAVWVIPKIYVENDIIRKGFYAIGGLVIYLLSAMLIFPGMKGCEARHQKDEQKINQMDPTWHNVYIQLKGSYDEFGDNPDAVKIIKSILKNPDIPNIKPEELELILPFCGTKRADIGELLAPYLTPKPTTRPVQ
jgi:hypothetical protein